MVGSRLERVLQGGARGADVVCAWRPGARGADVVCAWRPRVPTAPPTAPRVVAAADFGCEGFSLLITTLPLSSRTRPSRAMHAVPAHA